MFSRVSGCDIMCSSLLGEEEHRAMHIQIEFHARNGKALGNNRNTANTSHMHTTYSFSSQMHQPPLALRI
jgi:hypothetical protein